MLHNPNLIPQNFCDVMTRHTVTESNINELQTHPNLHSPV